MPSSAAPPRSRILALFLRNLEGEAEVRQVLAGVVRHVGQLRDHEVSRPLLFTTVDRGIEVNEVPAGVAGRLQRDLDIALAVERADVADIAVVVDDSVNIRGLGPADTFQMHSERRSRWTVPDIERKRGRLDPKAAHLLLGAD